MVWFILFVAVFLYALTWLDNRELRAKNAALRQRVTDLEAQLEAVEPLVATVHGILSVPDDNERNE